MGRIEKYEAKLDGDVIGARYTATKEMSVRIEAAEIPKQVKLENSVKAMISDVPSIQHHFYMAFAKQLNKKTSDEERCIINKSWAKRGLSPFVMDKIAHYIFGHEGFVEMICNCDTLPSWESMHGITPTLDLINKKEGIAAINFGKAHTTDPSFYGRWAVPVFDGTDKYCYLFVYIKDLTKYQDAFPVQIFLQSMTFPNVGYFYYRAPKTMLKDGWNLLRFKIQDQPTSPTPNIHKLSRITVWFVTIASSTTIPLGDAKFDAIFKSLC